MRTDKSLDTGQRMRPSSVKYSSSVPSTFPSCILGCLGVCEKSVCALIYGVEVNVLLHLQVGVECHHLKGKGTLLLPYYFMARKFSFPLFVLAIFYARRILAIPSIDEKVLISLL